MILNKKDQDLDVALRVKVEDFGYVIFVSSGTLKCFGCGGEGHLVRACPAKHSSEGKAKREGESGNKQGETRQNSEETTEKGQGETRQNSEETTEKGQGETRQNSEETAEKGQGETRQNSEETAGEGQSPDHTDKTEPHKQSGKSTKENNVEKESRSEQAVASNTTGGVAEGVVLSNNEDLVEDDKVCSSPALQRMQLAKTRGSQAKRGALIREGSRQYEEQLSDVELGMVEEEEEGDCGIDSQVPVLKEKQHEVQMSGDESKEDGGGVDSQPHTSSQLSGATNPEYYDAR
ncbi:processed variable antigen-like [Lampris incognitus]|uniref:processed variable antigen-like n=1 Tax=Lampris incognitus TaxID=2546036 RepID=UPI0024B50522|nr:processed variable antigen-like [Lampris incognitus]